MPRTEFPYLNKVEIAGQVVRDPELRYTASGVPVANFRIACSRTGADTEEPQRDEVCYVGVAAWRSLAKECKAALEKGSIVRVDGELKSRVRDSGGIKRSFVEIRAHRVGVYRGDGRLDELNGAESQEIAGPAAVSEPACNRPNEMETGSHALVAEAQDSRLNEYNSEREEL